MMMMLRLTCARTMGPGPGAISGLDRGRKAGNLHDKPWRGNIVIDGRTHRKEERIYIEAMERIVGGVERRHLQQALQQ